MRLSNIERDALKYALNDVKDPVFIFGSRTDNQKKGGDIDLLIYSKSNPFHLSRRVSTKYFSKCEAKLDVTVVDPDIQSIEQKSFINTLRLQPLKL